MPLWYYCISRLQAGMGYLRDIILRAALRHTCTAAEHTSSAHTAYPATPDNLTAHKKRSNSSPITCELRGLLHLGLEWTTGMSLDFKFNHNANQDVGWCLHPTQYTLCNWSMVHHMKICCWLGLSQGGSDMITCRSFLLSQQLFSP